jgi:EAL domain-containing protein (putative c-di-GMP-specific phosphodiesterase class I)
MHANAPLVGCAAVSNRFTLRFNFTSLSAVDNAWFLESVAADGSRLTHPIHTLPYRVGREPGNDLTVDARGLSRHHARLQLDAGGLLTLTDLDSTNGTYVNRERIRGTRALVENDVIHFGNAEYRLGLDKSTTMAIVTPVADQRTLIAPAGATLSENFVRHERQFMELLQGQGLSAAAQPIVDARNGQLFAYELLGRCTHPDLPTSPVHLFHLAAMLDREAELSEAFRRYGVAQIAPRLGSKKLFVNSHPTETFAESFFQALKALRAQQGAPELVVEVHETAVMEVARMKELAARLAEINVSFAYDDFGAGQARLNELGDVPAHFVKFDMGLIRGIHEANERKQRVVRDLVRLVLDLGSVPLAEGVELEAEAEVCRDMGFALVQGYLTGRPVPLASV